MFYIKTQCPVCRAGALGFTKCRNGSMVLLMCNECDAVWTDPKLVTLKSAIFPRAPDFTVEPLGCSVAMPGADWATRADITAAKWDGFIAGEGLP